MTTLINSIEEKPSSQLDSQVRLRDILNTLPPEVFVKNAGKAWFKVLFSICMVSLGYVLLAVVPWYLLPFVWIFTGTGLTGFFVLGHDCGHRSFSNRTWVNNLVGHLLFLPIIYPFHSWRILHDYHHKHTNKLEVDNAWDPFTPKFYDSFSPFAKWGYRQLRGRLWWFASVVHWAKIHFDWTTFEGKQREQVRFSVLVVLIGAVIGFPILFMTLGVWGFVKFWLLPWLVFHFWMSTFTLVHHTVPQIAFKTADQWNEAQAQLSGTVHCDYPRWVEILCHDINVHVPHHVSTGIPSYNLRQAYQSLKDNWGSYLCERRFSWSLMQEITTQCHLYHPENNYQSFTQYHQSLLDKN
ncbi:fatty acid desaturase [Rippkaea orientalis PCC 8801]|uniref:Fatty acid desaturase n=1 Tax=Rippkaea orientalis (strain PCC 8801 / RF-1) TaxID=41431 RepID=B7JUV3_RIPO1|nr:fatty acid desaturase [Rippkaea orientalis]ACK66805.1 fatty acid desaturase [Rippkaea orientalis PCC 8801]